MEIGSACSPATGLGSTSNAKDNQKTRDVEPRSHSMRCVVGKEERHRHHHSSRWPNRGRELAVVRSRSHLSTAATDVLRRGESPRATTALEDDRGRGGRSDPPGAIVRARCRPRGRRREDRKHDRRTRTEAGPSPGNKDGGDLPKPRQGGADTLLPHLDPGKVQPSRDVIIERIDLSNKEHACSTQSKARSSPKGESGGDPPEPRRGGADTFLPHLDLGDVGSSRDMILEPFDVSNKACLLQRFDFAFVLRSDRFSWTYAIVADASEDSILFVVDGDGSTKRLSRGQWASCVRMVVPEAAGLRASRTRIAASRLAAIPDSDESLLPPPSQLDSSDAPIIFC